MKRSNTRCISLGLSMLLASSTATYAGMIAHWSFDANTLSNDGSGNITGAADQGGAHNATLGAGVGSASVANGGPAFNSNPIPGSNSVAGQFGEALTFNGFNNAAGGGGQFLMFPNLTELMVSGGSPNYTVSYWLKTTTTNQHQFTIMSDWGNSATNPGRFTYGYGVNFASGNPQMRAQSRAAGATSGTDIFARVITTAGLNNGSWHMLTWTFDTTTGTLRSYFDSALVDTFTSTNSNGFKMWNGSSSVGTFGLKGDTGNFANTSFTLDEAWVVNHAMTADEIQQLYLFNFVPEPTSLALVAIGGAAGLALVSRCRDR